MGDPLVIKPTIGRQLWFWDSGSKRALAASQKSIQPEAATVCYVWGDRMVNLQVISSNGVARSVTSVELVQPDDPWNDTTGPHSQWMPFQAGQVRGDQPGAKKPIE